MRLETQMKRVVALILALLISFSIISMNVHVYRADTFNSNNEASQHINIRLNELRMLYTNATKERGNIPKLIKLYAEYIVILDFVENTTTMKNQPDGKFDYTISQSQYNEYVNFASTMSAEINKLYNKAEFDGEDGADPVSTSIEDRTVEFWLNRLNTGSFNLPASSPTSNRYRDEILHILSDYVKPMLDILAANSLELSDISEIPRTMSDEDINKIISANKSMVTAITLIYNAVARDVTYWNNISITDYSSNKFQLNSVVLPEWSKKLMEKVLNSGEADNKGTDVTLKDANSVLEMLTNTSLQSGKLIIDGDKANLTSLGYVLIAAGCTYDSFNSIAGNDLYLETLREFITNDSQWDKATTIVKKAISMKKPLYVATARTTNTNGKSSDAASYRLAFLTDIIDTIENKKDEVLQFSVLKGKMMQSAVDSSTFEYTQNGASTNTTTEVVNTEISASTDTDTQTNGSDSTNEQENNTSVTQQVHTASSDTDKYTTVGSNSLVASSTEMTEPIMYIASMGKGSHGISKDEPLILGHTTSMLLHNARMDSKKNKNISSAGAGILFVNGLGDIVTADDTVILPAIANPVLFPYDELTVPSKVSENSEHPILKPNGTEFVFDKDMDKGYYPYTASFMNHIPEIKTANNDNNKLLFPNNKDQDKFVVLADVMVEMAEAGIHLFTARITGTNKKGGTIQAGTQSIMPININTFSVGEEGYDKNNTSAFRIYELGQKFTLNLRSLWHNGNASYLCKQNVYNAQSLPFFPVIQSDNFVDLLPITAPLTTSARRYIGTAQDGSNEWVPTGRFDIEHLITDMIVEALQGTQYANTIVKNAVSSYEDIVNDAPRRFEVFLTGITNNILNLLGKIDGVLAMHVGYENRVFVKIITFVHDFYIFIVIALIVVIAVKFLKNHLTVPHFFVIITIMISCFEVYTTVLPDLIPKTYNFFVNDIVEDISWNSIYNAAENYSETYLNPNRVSPNGELKPYTATITLYQLSNADIENASSRLGIDEAEIRSGELIYLDQPAGIFLEGSKIKMSLDTALTNKTIRGLYKSQWDDLAKDQNIELKPIEVLRAGLNPYQIRLLDTVKSLDSYYTPYNEMMQSFIDNLNMMSSIFNIQRNTFTYDKDFSKDAFMVNSYIQSGLFLDPGNWQTLRENIVEDVSEDGDFILDDIKQLVETKFKQPTDWLGMCNWILTPTDEMKETLWARTLQANGYYENDWKPTYKMNDLIRYTNMHTKRYIINNIDQIVFSSDENAIKLISLFATTAMNHRASQYTSWLYPNYANSADIELEDVLYASMTTLQDRNLAVEDSLVDTIRYVYGIMGLLLLILILIFSNIFIFVLTYFIPILYLLLGAVVLTKMVASRNSSSVVKGYCKATMITLILYFVYNCALTVANALGHHWFALVFLALSSFLCCWYLAFVILSVVTNLTDLGNETLKDNILRATNSLTLGGVNKVRNMIDRRRELREYKNTNLFVEDYGRNSSIDSMPVSRGARTITKVNTQNTYSPYKRKTVRRE